MQVGRPVVHEPYVMQEVNRVPYPLQAVDVEKDLGVWIDSKLKFSVHVQQISRQACGLQMTEEDDDNAQTMNASEFVIHK